MWPKQPISRTHPRLSPSRRATNGNVNARAPAISSAFQWPIAVRMATARSTLPILAILACGSRIQTSIFTSIPNGWSIVSTNSPNRMNPWHVSRSRRCVGTWRASMLINDGCSWWNWVDDRKWISLDWISIKRPIRWRRARGRRHRWKPSGTVSSCSSGTVLFKQGFINNRTRALFFLLGTLVNTFPSISVLPWYSTESFGNSFIFVCTKPPLAISSTNNTLLLPSVGTWKTVELISIIHWISVVLSSECFPLVWMTTPFRALNMKHSCTSLLSDRPIAVLPIPFPRSRRKSCSPINVRPRCTDNCCVPTPWLASLRATPVRISSVTRLHWTHKQGKFIWKPWTRRRRLVFFLASLFFYLHTERKREWRNRRLRWIDLLQQW